MQAERWALIERICQEALDRPPDERAAYLSEVCADDESLRQEVASLLACESVAERFIEAPPADLAAGLMAQQPALKSPIGRQVRHYEILSLLGAGGMGEVYLARDTRLKRKIALKLLPAAYTRNEERVRRFEREALAASALNHPNILTIYEIGECEGTHFIVTEYVEGETLRQWMKDRKPTLAEILKLAEQIAGALAIAHAAGVIHRDIKPENVMVRPDGLVKVLDFGLAKLVEQEAPAAAELPTTSASGTASGMVMGTLRYMSPEQARGQKVDGRTDLFSLGVMLYELITGQAPFAGETSADLIAAILTREPAPLRQSRPEAPETLERIIATALRKDREERYATAQGMLAELTDLRQELELAARLGQPLSPISNRPAQENNAVATGPVAAADTGKTGIVHTEHYWLGQVKRHRLVMSLLLLALALAVAGIFYYSRRAPALTPKDVILLAEFSNLTGETAFDLTLKQALAVQLEQSPFLNVFPEERTRETLRFMNRAADAPVTITLGREICQRQGLKAMLTGTITGVGNHYVITLQALDGQTGSTLTRVQTEAESKEQVLRKLSDAAAQLREDLGESLRSIRQFSVPVEQATTSSLEAFKAFSLGLEQGRSGANVTAVSIYQRAIELDPQFALAHARLAPIYRDLGQVPQMVQAATRAFELQERANQREKFEISLRYYDSVTGETDKLIEMAQLFKSAYPNSVAAHTMLGLGYLSLGQSEQAIEPLREALRLDPRSVTSYSNLGQALLQAGQFPEARSVLEQALEQKLQSPVLRRYLFEAVFAQGDNVAAQQILDLWSRAYLEHLALYWQGRTMAFAGRLLKARELYRRAVDLWPRNREEIAGQTAGHDALAHAVSGACRQVDRSKPDASLFMRGRSGVPSRAIAWALCGQLDQAQSLADELVKQHPKDTVVNAIWSPTMQAAIEIKRGNYARAVELLQGVRPYEEAALFLPGYLRGQAYLRQGVGAAAAAEFQQILDHRGWSALSYLHPLAHLGLARATALTGDTARSRQAYQDFLALWREADPDLPILIEAKREYERLK